MGSFSVSNICKKVCRNTLAIKNDIVATGKGYCHAGRNGWRNANTQTKNPVNRYAKKTYSALKSTVKYADKSHIPYLCAIAGFCTAVPGGTEVGYLLGKNLPKTLSKLGSSIVTKIKEVMKNKII